jgi:hypothetical protein
MSQWPGSDHRSSFSGRKKDSLGREWHTFSAELEKMHTMRETTTSEFMEKTFQAAQLTHERFLTIDHSWKIIFWYLPNWTSTDLSPYLSALDFSNSPVWNIQLDFFPSLNWIFCL